MEQRVIDACVRVAKGRGLDPVALQAVVHVESGGVAVWSVGGQEKPAIRFEGHYFHRLLSGQKRSRAINKGLASRKAGAVRNPRGYAARYDLLDRAILIDRKAALRSTSWGLGQVMGDHYVKLGYATVEDLVRACDTIEGQIDLMARFIVTFGLVDALNKRRWAQFAKRYNGPGYRKNRYDTKMATAYRRFKARRVSARDPDIVADLTALGFKTDPIQTYKDSIRTFQDQAGLLVDGIPGPMTLAALDEAIAARTAKRNKTNATVTSGAGVIVAGMAGKILDQVPVIGDQINQVQTVLASVGISGPVATGILAGVVSLMIYRLVRTDDKEEMTP